MKNISGFTLLELMIGASVIIVALGGLIAAFTGCFALNETARNLTIAINDAQCVMEEMRDRDIPDNITQEDWTAWASNGLPNGGGCNSLDNEVITVTYPQGTEVNPIEIMVTVSWAERGRQRNAQLTTLLTER